MDYHPLKDDVLRLSTMFRCDEYNTDLIKRLDNIMECDENECDGLSVNIDLNQETDYYLATIRSDASEEFSRNGIEQDMDEVDVIQFKLRERTITTSRPIQPQHACHANYNQVAVEYMSQKQRKSKKKMKPVKNVCVFCKNNNEQPQVYQSHVLKDSEGRITCPILRKYTCPICGVKGDEAHTIRLVCFIVTFLQKKQQSIFLRIVLDF